MKVNEAQLRTALDAAGSDVRLFLIHGPDESGAAAFAERLARRMGPGAERVDLDGAALGADPVRLADEAASLSLFGAARFIRVREAGDNAAEAFELLLAAERTGNPVIALGPTLKATGKLVKLAIASPRAMSYAAYVPDGVKADQLAIGIARDHGLRLSAGASARLVAATGADRAILTREIEKLALYLDAAPDRPRDADDEALDAIGADLGEGEMMRVVGVAIDGGTHDIGIELKRLTSGGVSPVPLLRQLARRLMQLAEMRSEVDAGAGIPETVEKHRIFFREKQSYNKALRRWTPRRLAAALDEVRSAERAVMASGGIGELAAETAITRIARAAAREPA